MIEGFLVRRAPRMPARDSLRSRALPFAISAVLHAGVISAVVMLVSGGALHSAPASASIPTSPRASSTPPPRIVFLPSTGPGGGGGGGGNRQAAPIRRAERVGHDRMTVPVAPAKSPAGRVDEPEPAQQIALDARPLGRGLVEQIGVIEGGVDFGTSQGPGSGGGAGEGTGTGVGPGRGPGLGPGSGGGIGGGVYRPGGSVLPPRILVQVRPSYTDEALRLRIQGSVVLELIVRRDGEPSDIRVVRSLDPGGLDLEAITAVRRWRFIPGQLGGAPVDVQVTVVLDFSIR